MSFERVEVGEQVLYRGRCEDVLPTLPVGSFDCVITDPPYPEIDRPYGRMTEPEWHAMMDVVVSECRRVLKPSGSAVFILQPNSERVGRMRTWLWEFLAKWGREWGMVHDVWWWNIASPPTVHTHRDNGLARPSLKACVWLGSFDCYRDQGAVLLPAAEATVSDKRVSRHELGYSPSGLSMRKSRVLQAFRDRGGVTPFNVIVCPNTDAFNAGASVGHGAATPMPLCVRWVRYICPAGGVALDPFAGSATVGMAAVAEGCRFVGIEQDDGYFRTAARRLESAVRDARDDLFSTAPATATTTTPAPAAPRGLFDGGET